MFLAALVAAFWAFVLWDGWRGRRRFPHLLPPCEREAGDGRQTGDAPDPELPFVSVVVAARNEAETLRQALPTLLGQAYPAYEVIVVDDRSTDGTSAVAAAVAAELGAAAPPVRLIRIDALPPGWLGKNHALAGGAAEARGSLLLFTDADVHFQEEALRTAVRFMRARRLDHLALTPRLVARQGAVRRFSRYFMFSFMILERLWWAGDPERKHRGAGVGAFNLVRRSAYEAVGGHAAIALRPDDDLALGRRLRAAGFRQAFAGGAALLSVEWYPSLRAAAVGLEKNALAGVGYRYAFAAAALLGQALFFLWPFVAVWITEGWARAGYAFSLAAMIALYVRVVAPLSAERRKAVLQDVPFLPLTAIGFNAIFLRAIALTAWRGGITWRGTFYSLAELRAGMGSPAGASCRGERRRGERRR
ncbi:glycosyltransferase family 2 protein [Hydrogenibacillus sp. N12]|uniref:glycosyltransferase n=1 Tax=Hydrogenibacillus sp. N12 TaxID=2866627 RepID=UPI001C7D7305|nr:glycosyltransferase family 2 protein [Hydrogenibacillus sp. N12]QZA32201.1 glycosyltransferase family 2 protein [Hydrogenibacillus sp. N12]